jgi:hypothetical protein
MDPQDEPGGDPSEPAATFAQLLSRLKREP